MNKIIVSLLLLTAFSLEAADPKKFNSKNGKFSIELPYLIGKPYIYSEEFEDDTFMSAIDDFGTLFRIDHMEIDENEVAWIKTQGPTEGLKRIFKEVMLMTIQSAILNAEVIKEGFLQLTPERTAYFALVNMPKGSCMVECETQDGFDSMRGILTFLDDENVVFLSYQTDLTFAIPLLPASESEVYKRYLSTLIKSAQSFVRN